MTESTQAVLALLDAKQREVEDELASLTAAAEDADAGGIAFGKRVGDGTSVAVERITQVAAYDRLEALLTQVRGARDRVAAGTYGSCERCGRPIGAQRLEALPWAARCIDCASL